LKVFSGEDAAHYAHGGKAVVAGHFHPVELEKFKDLLLVDPSLFQVLFEPGPEDLPQATGGKARDAVFIQHGGVQEERQLQRFAEGAWLVLGDPGQRGGQLVVFQFFRGVLAFPF
jgi:hypothetical protein